VKTTTKTNYNDITLLNNSNTYRVNTGNGGTLTVKMQNMTSSSGGTIDIEDIDLTTDAQGALSKIDNTSAEISKIRSDFGSQLNAMDSREEFNQNLSLAYETSRSRIEDADMAKEMSELTKNKILYETNLQMLQQYNDLNSMMLLLFEK
jgi:flagellin